MLSTYAPVQIMDCLWSAGARCGSVRRAGGHYLQMDGFRRGGAFFGSAGARRGEIRDHGRCAHRYGDNGVERAAGAKPKPTPTATPLSVSIDSPGNEQTITGNQPVKVHLAVTPDLKPGQAITWYLNGGPLTQPPDATQFTLEDLARGTYILGATVVDQASGESKSAEPVTFYVMRTNLLSPQRKGSQ